MIGQYLKTHERLLLVLAGLLVVLWLGHLYIVRSADNADIKAKTAQATAKAQAAADKELADQVKQSTAQYAQLITQLSAQNQQLTQSIASRNQTVVVQQAKDASLTAPQVAAKLAQQTGTKPTDVTSQGTDVTLNDAASHAAVQKMDELDSLRRNQADYETLLDNDKTQIQGLTKVTVDQADEITGLKTELTDNAKACTVELDAAKKDARRGKMRAFGYGLGTGIAVTIVAGLKASHVF